MSPIAHRVRLVHRALRYRFKLNRPQIAAMLALLPRGGVGVDVGAHKGAYSFWMARRVGSRGRVLAFEPQSRLAADTARTLRKFPQIRFRHAAVSDHCGRAMLSFRTDSTHGASLDGFDQAESARTAQEEVELITVDEAVRQAGVPRVDFVKIDVEGHELAVLRGCEETIRAWAPAFLIELESRHHSGISPVQRATELLAAHGYSAYFFAPPEPGRATLRPAAEFRPEVHQNYGAGPYCNDFLFVRGNAPAL